MKNYTWIEVLKWFLAIILAAIILCWPVNYQYQTNSVQSLSAINHPILLGCIFTLFSLLIFNLASRTNKTKNILLIIIFCSVFGGFFIINCPYIGGASYDPGGIAYAQYIIKNGHIVLNQGMWGYFEFPAISLWGSITASITGLDLYVICKIFSVIASFLLPTSAYILYTFFSDDQRNNLFLTIATFIGSIFLVNLMDFRPGTLGFLFFAPFMILLVLKNRTKFTSLNVIILLLLLTFAFAITHFISAATFLFSIFGLVVVKNVLNRNSLKREGYSVILLVGVIVVAAWFVYVAQFQSLSVIRLALENIAQTANVSLFFALKKGQALVGPAVPMWESITRLFWIVAIFVLPCILLLVKFIKSFIRRQNVIFNDVEGVLLGIALLTIVMTLADKGANRSVEQFFLSCTFLSSVLLLEIPKWLKLKLPRLNLNYVFIQLSIGLIISILVFPTLLANHPSVESSIYYAQEDNAFKLIADHSVDTNSALIYTDANTAALMQFYLPNSNYVVFPYPPDDYTTINEFHSLGISYMQGFLSDNRQCFFILSPKIYISPDEMLGISNQDSYWQYLGETLDNVDCIYTNNMDAIFVNIR
jgi:hypothetical protein